MNLRVLEHRQGQYAVASGLCRISQAKRLDPTSHLVAFTLELLPAAEEPVVIRASADTRHQPFLSLLADGIAAFVMRTRLSSFRFRVESRRRPGVDSKIPFADLQPGDVVSALRVLELAGARRATRPTVDAPDFRM